MTPQTDVALAPFCTMQVGGPARWFVEAQTEHDVIVALSWAQARDVPVHVLGGGSNVVVADRGIDGLVLKISITGIQADARRSEFCAGAGEPWDPFVAQTVAADCAGLECLSGIPGLVGGTPVQNVGAYGQDVSGTITRVHVIDRHSRAAESLSNAGCDFGYRTSRFKRADANRYIVTRVDFSLTPGGSPTLTYGDVVAFFAQKGSDAPPLGDVREAILEIRRRKGMVIEPGNAANRSCGSFFVNPVVSRDALVRVEALTGSPPPHFAVDAAHVKIPAAWLIEHAGFRRGVARGAAGISPFQAQAIINLGGATAADVLALACEVKAAVWNTFGIAIVPEPVFVGFASSDDLRLLLSAGADATTSPGMDAECRHL